MLLLLFLMLMKKFFCLFESFQQEKNERLQVDGVKTLSSFILYAEVFARGSELLSQTILSGKGMSQQNVQSSYLDMGKGV